MISAQYASDRKTVASHVKAAGGLTAVHSGVTAALRTPDVRNAWSALYVGMITDVAGEFARASQEEIASYDDDIDLTDDDELDAGVSKYAAGYTDDRVDDMLNATANLINRRFDRDILAGLTLAELLSELDDIYSELEDTGADALAEYEAVLAGNWGMDFGAFSLDVSLEKTWYAVLDERTREWHAEMDGTTIPNDEAFDVDGEQMMYPMDDSLGATGRNIYGCRCVSGYIPTSSA